MQTTVKKWFKDKGYGFLDNGNGPDILVRVTELKNCHYLRPGTTVSFECHMDKRGLAAKNVMLRKETHSDNVKPFRIGVMT